MVVLGEAAEESGSLLSQIREEDGTVLDEEEARAELAGPEMLLKQQRMTISEVAFTVGFNDPKYFSKSFRSQFGKTPTEYIESLKN